MEQEMMDQYIKRIILENGIFYVPLSVIVSCGGYISGMKYINRRCNECGIKIYGSYPEQYMLMSDFCNKFIHATKNPHTARLKMLISYFELQLKSYLQPCVQQPYIQYYYYYYESYSH